MQRSDQEQFARFTTGSVTSDGEQRAFCPLCEDPDKSKSASASFNWDGGVWHCMSCNNGGAIAKLRKNLLAMRRAKTTKTEPVVASVTAINSGKELPTEEQVKLWHNHLMQVDQRLEVMRSERGLLDDTIQKFEIGFDGYRYTIPVRDANGKLVNVRRYDPKAKRAQDKMLSIQGHGEVRIFHPELLNNLKGVAIITEGEMDFMVAHQMGLPAITHTAGAGTFMPKWGPLFHGMEVYICYDCDDSGRAGAIKAARILRKHADLVCIMDLGLDIKGGDVTDFFIKQGNNVERFREIMAAAAEHPIGAKPIAKEIPTSGKPMSLAQSESSEHGSEPIEIVVTIAGKQNPPFLAPRKLVARCTQDKGNVCAVCPMAAMNGESVLNILPNDPILLEFADANQKAVQTTHRQMFGARCTDRIEYDVEEQWSLEELVVTNAVDYRGEDAQKPIQRRVLNVGTFDTAVNSTARIVGQQFADPKTQRGLFQSWHLEPTQTDLDKFEMTPEIYQLLKRFQPKPGYSPLQKMRMIANDIAANVTHIYGRPELHMAYDLVWHSIVNFDLQGKRLMKGWLELLVVGDTRTGKSETAGGLIHHYNAGVLKSCEGATFAGLVGGAQQLGAKQWMVTWGTIPLQDRRLVVLDEMSGLADKDVIEQMSSIRSSGKAQITKIVQNETSARTRLIWIANPADGRRLQDTSGSGMHAISTLVKNPEDIARFDLAMAASGDDVAIDLINTNTPPVVRHRYTRRACEALVLWSWSRTAEDVVWERGVESAVVQAATVVGGRYVSEPPLVQPENVRVKLARIAVAIASRTFSTDETGEKVVIKMEHVKAACDFLDMIYGMESFGYLRHSKKLIASRRAAQENMRHVEQYLRDNPDVLAGLQSINDDVFRTRDFTELQAMDQFEAQAATRYLLEKRMVVRKSKGYMRKEQALNSILNKLSDEHDARDLGE